MSMSGYDYVCSKIKRSCENKLGIKFRPSRSKEINGWFMINKTKITRITIPKGRRRVGKGLFNVMAKQLKLSKQQFRDLIDCPLTRRDYEEILMKKHKIYIQR